MHILNEFKPDVNKIERLYIIGNGFDLHHGIPSGYIDFYRWMKENDEDFLCRFGEYFPDAFSDDEETDKMWWCDFESNLDTADAHVAIDNAVAEYNALLISDSSDNENSDPYAGAENVKEEIRRLYGELQTHFEEWIRSLPEGDPIRMIHIEKEDSVFLSFNYTDTLESLYRIKACNIKHIHGSVSNGKETLVIGHGGDYEAIQSGTESELPDPPADCNTQEDMERWYDENSDDFPTMEARKGIAEAIWEFKKPVDEIIEQNRVFFGVLSSVSEIVVFGISFSNVDMPYLSRITEVVDKNNVKWTLGYFDDNTHSRIEDFVKANSIPEDNATIIHTSEFKPYLPTLPGM